MPTENPMIFSQITDDWEKELEDIEDIALAHEVDRYLLETMEKVPYGSQFDILKWWKLKGRSTYPTLALIAKDVLPIQVSTVASESAFSGGKRVIDPCRSCLLPQTVESLMCLQNWIRSEPIGSIEYEASPSELEFYQECEEGNYFVLYSLIYINCCLLFTYNYCAVFFFVVVEYKRRKENTMSTSSALSPSVLEIEASNNSKE